MTIKRFNISGFRSIKNSIELSASRLCALVGPNNSGKSNILQALYCVLGKDWITVNSFDGSDVYNEEFDRDIVIEIEFTEPYQHRQFHGVDPIPIDKIRFIYSRYKIGENKGKRRLEKKCLTANNKDVFVLAKKPKRGAQHEYVPLTTIPQELQESIPVVLIGSERTLRSQLPYARNSLLGALLADINTDFVRPENTISLKQTDGSELVIPRLKRFNDCVQEAVSCLRTDEFNRLEKAIKDNALYQLGFNPKVDADKIDIFFGPISSLDFYKQFSLYVKENNFSINATELGGGFQNAIVIAILKAFEERRKQGALFLIEEPEMFLHPQMQRSLYKTIRKIAETNQVIYVTHSPHFVAVPDFNEVVLVRKDKEGTRVKTSNLTPDPKRIEKFRKELDPERNELFFAKRVLVVEGDTEKLALPEYARRLGVDIDNCGSTIIETGGKRNIIDFVDLALSFEIPVAFCYDVDSTDFRDKDEEGKHNATLESYAKKGAAVWRYTNTFEDELRKFFGEQEYQKLCQRFERTSKPIRARLIASDTSVGVPEFVKPIVAWLGG